MNELQRVQQQPWGLPPAAAPAQRPVEFVSDGNKFLGIATRGGMLEILTFGFYRFWLVTAIRRYLWSNTLFDGENAEYTGTGRELLIGFLFALAILIPIYLVYFLIGLEAERLQAFASVPLVLFMLLFGYFAVYRARRYRLTRTIWRGVRFWMQGSGWKYALIAFGWGILVVLTIGAVYPWRAAALERYKMQNTFYGDLQGDFDARPAEFFRQGLGMWLAVIAVIVMIAAGTLLSVVNSSSAAGSGLIGAGIIAMLALPFMYPFFKALEWRWWASGVSIGGTRLACDLRGGALLGLYVKFALISFAAFSIAGLVLGGIFAAAVAALGVSLGRLNAGSIEQLFSGGAWMAVVPLLLGYLALILIAGILNRYYLQHELWRRISSSLTIVNPQAMEGVAAKGDAAHALGEGLADGLDVAGF